MKKLYVVHCVDAEGSLYESLSATFERLRKIGIYGLSETEETIHKLQRQGLDLGGREAEIASFLAPHRLNYMDNWNKLEKMIRKVTSQKFRSKYLDSLRQPYKFSWFIMDFVGFKTNPRRRPEGFHVMWDWYNGLLKNQTFGDGFFWHFHTVPATREGTEYNPCWTNNDYHEQVLCRRIIERDWFPSVFRSGASIEGLDLSFWLEMFIPFDFSNSSVPVRFNEERIHGDWRNAPTDWSGYHPNFYDYRIPGTMRRSIFRCLEIDNGRHRLNKNDVIGAFEQANKGNPAVLAFSNHDRRDMEPEIDYMHNLLTACSQNYPEVEWSYQNALDAVRLTKRLNTCHGNNLYLSKKKGLLWISSEVPTFCLLPFVAVKDKSGIFYRDNPMQESANRKWVYKIRHPEKAEIIGVAVTYPDGSVEIKKVSIQV